MTSKLKSQRPGSSYRVNDDENFGSETERRSKIPRLPKRTCSLEGKQNSHRRGRSSSRLRSSNASMIPRLEWKKNKKSSTPETPNRERHKSKAEPLQPETLKSPPPAEGTPEIEETNKKSAKSSHSKEIALESKINEDFINFKKNVLRIPEYWTDAGQTVTNILKNAINIVSKEYPSADVDSFEMEIQNILKATELVKQQILTKTENIINQASKIYSEKNMGEGEPSEKEILKIMKKMEELRQEVSARKNVFGDLLECSNEMKQLVDIEKSLKENSKEKNTKLFDSKHYKEMETRKTKMKSEVESAVEKKKRESMVMQSCGDVCREPAVYTAITAGKPSGESPTMFTDKSSQTMNFWTAELYRREEDLTILNNQIRELHQLCKDHISKFKSFNLQIKLRGICNKAQNLSVCKELQILNDEKLQLAEKNNRLLFYNKDLESAIKQRDMDLHQKDRLISQQKKLLHVRDELIEMLKSRCNIEELEQV